VKTACIIPVVQIDLAIALLKNILTNTKELYQLILIDNSENKLNAAIKSDEWIQDFVRKNAVPVRYDIIVNMPPLPLNETWTQGFGLISKEADLITVLNDDLIINTKFFECLENIAKTATKECGVFCPYTTRQKENVFTAINDTIIEVMYRREGWAYTMRREFFAQLKPIPKELKTFCGDDWIFLEAMRLGYRWIKMMHNPIYHYVGATVGHTESNKSLDVDKRMFYKLTGISLKELGNPRLNREKFK